MTALASNGWSGVAAIGSSVLTVGTVVTKSPDGNTFVAASTANLAAGTSKAYEGVVITIANPRQAFVMFRAGNLTPEQAPSVGAGNNTDFAAVDAAGGIIRQSNFANNVIGTCGADGSVFLDLTLGRLAAIIGGGSISTAIVDGTVIKGDVLVPADNATDENRLQRATSANLAAGLMPKGIALADPVLGVVVFAGIGVTVEDTVVGLADGTATWGVVSSTGRVVRKDAPEASDVVIGSVLPAGHVLIDPKRPVTSEIVVTHPPFNAKNDGSADASDAIRAAVAATQKTLLISGSARPLRFPSGDYIINKPIHIKYAGGNRVFGEGSHSTNLRNVSTAGPLLYVAPDRGEFPHLTNEFAGGSAITMRANALQNNEHWMAVGEYGAGHYFHGKSSFTWRGIIKIIGTTSTSVAMIFGSYGRRMSDEGIGGYAQGWTVGYAGSTGNVRNNAIFMTLTTTSGIVSTYTPTNSLLTGGSYHEVECQWDAGNFKIFIDGISQTLTTGSLAGTIVQKKFENCVIGGGYARFYSNREYGMADVNIASMALDNAVVHSANYTPTGAKLAQLASTTWHCNFDTYDGVFVVGATRPQTDSTSMVTAYWPHRQDQVATTQMPDCEIHDLFITNFYGPAIGAEAATRFGVRDIETSGKCGITADNNCYISTWQNIKSVAPSALHLPIVGFKMTAAANIESIRDLITQSFDHHLVSIGASDFTVQGYWYASASAEMYLHVVSTFMVALMGDMSFSDETASTSPIGYIAFAGVDVFIAHGLVMGQSVGSAGPLIIVQGDGSLGGALDADIDGYFSPHASSPGHFKILGSPTGLITARGHKNDSVPIATSGSSAGARIAWLPAERKAGTKAMPDSNYTLTRDEYLNRHIRFTGTLTAGRSVFFPAFDVGPKSVFNATNQNLIFSITGGATTWTIAAGAGGSFAPNATATELDRIG